MSNKVQILLSKYNQNKVQAKALADTLNKNRDEILEVLGINPKHILSDEEYEEYEQIKNCIDNICAIRNKTFRAVPELYDKPDTSARDIFEEGINDGLVFLKDEEEKEENQ